MVLSRCLTTIISLSLFLLANAQTGDTIEPSTSVHFASNPNLYFAGLPPPEQVYFSALESESDDQAFFEPSATLRAIATTVYRPTSNTALQEARLRSLYHEQSEKFDWIPKTIYGPDVHDRHTLAQLARMAGNAYALPGQKSWYDVDFAWNHSFPFGWEDAADGFRGHVFVSSDNSTVILSIKGTTLRGETSKKDKFNDNLLFSCCCARLDFSWVFKTVCDCYSGSWQCDNNCLSEALIRDSLFYTSGVKLVNELIAYYPLANIWLVGHSLGGALASLLGSTFGFPAVAFESPGERLAAQRLHLPLPPPVPHPGPSLPPVPITHVFHTADPIPQGTCTGFSSVCERAGYALETHCHLGKNIVFDTVSRLGWKADVRKHPIKQVVHNVLEVDDIVWEDGLEPGEVPLAKAEDDCVDCYKWEFGDFKPIV